MRRRDFVVGSASLAAGVLVPGFCRAASPCPPPRLSAEGGTAAATPCVGGANYSTEFAGTENPISEGGAWTREYGRYAAVQTTPGLAFNTRPQDDGLDPSPQSRYDDAYARLSGYGPDQEATGTIYKASGIDATYQEVELLLRWADTASSARGYECLWNHNGSYMQIVRWNGTLGDFTYVADQRSGVPVPKTGDVFKARVVGNVITCYVNDSLIVTGTDSAYATGDPGIGFFLWGSQSNLNKFGFSAFTAIGL